MVQIWELGDEKYCRKCGAKVIKEGGFFRCPNCNGFYILKRYGLSQS